jgi:hypothetical protein
LSLSALAGLDPWRLYQPTFVTALLNRRLTDNESH